MKLVTFETKGGDSHIGALSAQGDGIVDFTASDGAPAFRDMLSLIDGGEAALDRARKLAEGGKGAVVVPAAGQKLLAPVPEPRQMRDFLCFEQHLRQARANRYLFGIGTARLDPASIDIPKVWYEQPVYYKCNRFSVIGTGQDVLWPRYTKMLDYELEFGVFTSKRGKNIPREKARDYIFGYCIFNDMSARDAQIREMQGQLGPAKGKDFDTGNVMGPWLVTADEIADPKNLTMVARVNGEEWSRGNSRNMHHAFEDILAHASRDETLMPGEFFGSGTVGNGCGLEHGRFLKPNDVIELEVEGLGTLTNRVVAQDETS
jgi:2-keto-4-pentenoate hydratase/2-oxohepta-3-ene-1,7-dioic acid hydratase in catechol pathway